MPSRFGLTHGLMIVAALVAFAATTSVLQQRGEQIEVLVADRDLARGERVDPGGSGLRSVLVPVAQPLASKLVRPSELAPGILSRAIRAGEPLLDSDLVGLVGGSGRRTMSLPVTDRTVRGLGLVPGDQVDVIGLDPQKSPVVVVEGAWIVRLADATGSVGLGAGLVSEFVTVEVDQDQALELTAALANGDLQLLRSTGAVPGARS